MSIQQTVKLKNGSEEFAPMVAATMMSIEILKKDGILGLTQFYDLVMVCKDPNYKIHDKNLKALQDLSLLQSDGKPHDSIKNIILSAVVGEGMNMILSSPIAD